VVGYLPGYLREEDYTSGGRFLLASALQVPPSLALGATALAAGMVVVGVLGRPPPFAAAATMLVATVLLATTPVQPWYGGLLLATAAVAGEARWTALVAAGYPYFFAVILDQPHRTAIGQLAYGAAAVIVAAAGVRARRAGQRGRGGRPAGDELVPAPGGPGLAAADAGAPRSG
jgi:hypothetical protein